MPHSYSRQERPIAGMSELPTSEHPCPHPQLGTAFCWALDIVVIVTWISGVVSCRRVFPATISRSNPRSLHSSPCAWPVLPDDRRPPPQHDADPHLTLSLRASPRPRPAAPAPSPTAPASPPSRSAAARAASRATPAGPCASLGRTRTTRSERPESRQVHRRRLLKGARRSRASAETRSHGRDRGSSAAAVASWDRPLWAICSPAVYPYSRLFIPRTRLYAHLSDSKNQRTGDTLHGVV